MHTYSRSLRCPKKGYRTETDRLKFWDSRDLQGSVKKLSVIEHTEKPLAVGSTLCFPSFYLRGGISTREVETLHPDQSWLVSAVPNTSNSSARPGHTEHSKWPTQAKTGV